MNATVPPISFSEDCTRVDWVRLAEIFRRAPLSNHAPARLKTLFEQSTVCCFACAEGTLVGAGRAISDRTSYTAVFDVAVAPEFQRRGIGTDVVRHLIHAAGAPNVILHAVPGRESFYARLGFRRMTTAMALFSNPDLQRRAGYIE